MGGGIPGTRKGAPTTTIKYRSLSCMKRLGSSISQYSTGPRHAGNSTSCDQNTLLDLTKACNDSDVQKISVIG